jgi:hypothetical protein
MNKAAIAAGLFGLALAQATAAATLVCPPRGAHQSEADWRDGARHYCEVRWSNLLARKATGRWTQPHFIDDCLRRCRAAILPTNASLALGPVVTASVAAAGVAGVVANSLPSEKPASP